ncbi:hypothetical protein [Shewanella sp. NKUCC06_TVS]|uniref:hypothetical protein n=1 Tax=Shewanella sp. NKUCC06_TVS TaxID=2842128 RepID=UPI001C5B8660|nr:hypothetical protein [Shewanella sp. NKUCC06_TVS]MBW3530702.1 hypothetical protein [Shewanella sp. NKUCC06_TVS]
MKGRRHWMTFILSRSLFVGLFASLFWGYSAFSAANVRVTYCDAQLAKMSADALIQSRSFGEIAQQHLAIVYGDNADYLADAASPSHPLSDGKVGRVTNKWLSYFCQEFNPLTSATSSNSFVAQLFSFLTTAAELAQTYPTWRQILISEPFQHWVAERVKLGLVSQPSCLDIPYCYGTPTQLRGLFDRFAQTSQAGEPQFNEPDYYHPIITPEKRPQSYYQLSAADISQLTIWSENLSKFNELVGKPFATYTEIGTALTPVVTALVGTSDREKLTAVLDKLVTVTPAKYKLLSAPMSTEASAESHASAKSSTSVKDAAVDNPSAANATVDSAADVTVDSAADSTSVTGKANSAGDPADEHEACAPQTPAPQTTQVLTQSQNYTVTRASADTFLAELAVIALNKPQLSALSTLSDVPFFDRYLFGVAVKDLGETLLQPSTLNSVYKLAYKMGKPGRQDLKPLLWQASPGCGCTENSAIEGKNTPSQYGFYPYWQQDPDVVINYNNLTRMGYFSASVVGQQISLPGNWRGEKPFSQFAINAHNYRVKVDLVVSSHQDPSNTAYIAPVFNQALIDNILAAVKTPIIGDAIDRLKPVISVGTSQRRTMADGVTLNLDLKDINSQAKIDEFIYFIQKLKLALNGEKATSAAAKAEDEYYLNMVLPAYELKQIRSPFYTVDNLAKIEAYVNLFIVNFSPLSTIDSANYKPLGNESQASHSDLNSSSINARIASLKGYRTLLGEQQYSEIAGGIFAKSLPMIRTNDVNTQELQQILDYTTWSYRGAAFWSFPLTAQTMGTIEQSYFPPPVSEYPLLEPAVAFADEVCNVLCPLRWPLRLAFFIIAILVLVYVIASIWIFALRELFSRWYFLVFLLLSSIFIILVFSCDPYWQEQQQLFLFIFILGIYGYNFFRQLSLKKRRSLP